MGSPFIIVLLVPLIAFAWIATWILRMWINEGDSPEAKPRHALFIASIFPWLCIAWALWVLIFWEGGVAPAQNVCVLSLVPAQLMPYVLFIPPQIGFGALLWWLRALRAGARPVATSRQTSV